jgi:metallophosphoesterase superfamily enzyme
VQGVAVVVVGLVAAGDGAVVAHEHPAVFLVDAHAGYRVARRS